MTTAKSNRGGKRPGAGRKPTGAATGIPKLISLSPEATAIYETQPRGRKGDWVSRLIELNASAAIEPGTRVRPVGGVDAGTVVFCDSREIVVRWATGLRVHQINEVEQVPTLIETVEVEW